VAWAQEVIRAVIVVIKSAPNLNITPPPVMHPNGCIDWLCPRGGEDTGGGAVTFNECDYEFRDLLF